MANPTTHTETFDGSLGSFSGVAPTRYDAGLYLEQATTNYSTNPLTFSAATGWSSAGKGSGIAASLAWNAGPPASVRWSVTSVNIASGAYMDMSRLSQLGTFAAGEPCTVSVAVIATGPTASVRAAIWPTDSTGTIIGSQVLGTLVAATGTPQILTVTTASLPVGTSRVLAYANTVFGGNDASPSTVDVVWSQIEKSLYATSICPEINGAGTPNTGYAFTGTAHASTSTRAASSASIATAGILSPSAGAIAFRFTRKIDTAGIEYLLIAGTDGDDRLRIYVNTDDTLHVAWDTGSALPQEVASLSTIAVDTEYFVYTYWDETIIGLSIDNGETVVGVRDVPLGSWGTDPLTLQAT